jgi:hypothetical protein
MTDAETPLSAAAARFVLFRDRSPAFQAVLDECPWLLDGAKLTGGKKEHREFVAKCLDDLAAASEPL